MEVGRCGFSEKSNFFLVGAEIEMLQIVQSINHKLDPFLSFLLGLK